MGQTAIFGGTFNPPHLGHRVMVEWAVSQKKWNQILVIPSFLPPHKQGEFASPEDRLAMCRLAFANLSTVSVSNVEVTRREKSYTIETLEELEKCGIFHPTLIIGADSLVQFHTWFRYTDILQKADLFAYRRDGISQDQMEQAAVALRNLGGCVTILTEQPPPISSSAVRQALEQGISADQWLEPSVIEYIASNGLYKGEKAMEKWKQQEKIFLERHRNYVDHLKKRLTERRFYHSLCVATEALRLADRYGAPLESAFLAGLLHDVCKDNTREEQLQYMKQFGIILDTTEQQVPKLWHAKVGTAYLQQVLQIKDEEILSAVSFHTTAKADMTLLETILYLADYTSFDRDYDGVEEMRRAVDEGLEVAMQEALIFTVMDLKQKGCAIHPDTLEAYAQYVGQTESL